MGKIKRKTTSPSIGELVEAFAAAKRQEQEAAARKAELSTKLVEMLDMRGESYIHDFGDGDIRSYTRVAPTRNEVDWGGIAEVLTEKQLELVTRSVIDPALFNSAVEIGKIPPGMLEEFTTTKAVSPYVKETKR